MENLTIYDKVRAVPSCALKPITAGRLKGMSDINPMWRIKTLTEMFGPCGVGWWYEITDKRFEHDPITKQTAAFVEIKLYYIDPKSGTKSHGIPGLGGASFVAQERNGAYMSDECEKMALTDAISVAAKALGVAADVYFAKDRTKYDAQTSELDSKPPVERKPPVQHDAKPKEDLVYRCEKCNHPLTIYFGADGKPISLRKWSEGTKKKFGKVLCDKCVETVNTNEDK